MPIRLLEAIYDAFIESRVQWWGNLLKLTIQGISQPSGVERIITFLSGSLWSLENLQELSLRECTFNDNIYKIVKVLPKTIHTLDLRSFVRDSNQSEKTLIRLVAPALKILKLPEFPDSPILILKTPKLETLDLSYLQHGSLSFLKKNQSLIQNLKSIYLSRDIDSIASCFLYIKRVKEFNGFLGSKKEFSLILRSFENLKSLSVSSKNESDKLSLPLDVFEGIYLITKLSLHNCQLHHSVEKFIHCFPMLKYLELDNCDFILTSKYIVIKFKIKMKIMIFYYRIGIKICKNENIKSISIKSYTSNRFRRN